MGIALDTPEGKMYWTDEQRNQILTANLDGSDVQILPNISLAKPYGIALIPEPTSIALLAMGGMWIATRQRRSPKGAC